MEFPLKEREIQSVVAELYRSVGAAVYSTSVYRPGGAKIAAGIPDLIVIFPQGGMCFHETKRPKSKQSDEQIKFESQCINAGVAYVLGGFEEAQSFLEGRGILK